MSDYSDAAAELRKFLQESIFKSFLIERGLGDFLSDLDHDHKMELEDLPSIDENKQHRLTMKDVI